MFPSPSIVIYKRMDRGEWPTRLGQGIAQGRGNLVVVYLHLGSFKASDSEA